jgi:hypothetical protein
VRILTILILLLSSTAAFAESLNLSIPNAPQNYQQDRFRSGDMDCSNAIGSGANLEFGVMGLIEKDNPYDLDSLNRSFNGSPNNVGVYGRIVIPLGGPKERINCNTLYELELHRRRLEIRKLEQEIQQLRALQFEN